MRLVVPWALLAMMPISFLLPGWLYQTAFWCQAAFYLLGLLGLLGLSGLPGRLTGAAASFMVLEQRRLGGLLGLDQRPGGEDLGQAESQCSVFGFQCSVSSTTKHGTSNAEH